MSASTRTAPQLVVFEGVDGTGKTMLTAALARYYRERISEKQVLAASFPGSIPGTLGELVYKLHHGQLKGAPNPSSIAGPAVQLLHVAAHIDAIERTIAPVLTSGGCVILDRYWWSTYAYVRQWVTVETAWCLIGAETPFWEDLPFPVVVYLQRRESLKPDELGHIGHEKIAGYYEEVLEKERVAGTSVIMLRNDSTVEDTWEQLLKSLHLVHHPFYALGESDDHT